MTGSSIGVAVVGAGMAGRSHAAGYRSASTLYGEGLPDIRLAAVADINPAFAGDTARRFGFERAETGWEAVAAADDVDVVSVAVANALARSSGPRAGSDCTRSPSQGAWSCSTLQVMIPLSLSAFQR